MPFGFGYFGSTIAGIAFLVIYGVSFDSASLSISNWGTIGMIIGYVLDAIIILIIYKDAKKNDVRLPFLWAVIAPGGVGAGLIPYFIVRAKRKNTKKIMSDYTKTKEAERQEKDLLFQSAFASQRKGEWEKAAELFEAALCREPNNAKLHIGKLCVELCVNSEDSLMWFGPALRENINYERALMLADEEYKGVLELYAITKEERDAGVAEKERKYLEITSKYNEQMIHKDTDEYKALISELIQMGDYNDSIKMLNTLIEPIKKTDGNITCPLCGTVQLAGRSICYYCEIPFSHERTSGNAH